MNIINIENLDDERVEEFKTLKDKSLSNQGLLIAESKKVVLKLINSDHEILKLLITDDFLKENESTISSLSCEVFVANKKTMEEIVGFNLHHGIMALAKRPKYVRLGELGNKILIYNGLTSPENVGTMIRNAAAFKVNSIIIDQNTCSPYVRRCVRVSMGNIFNVKVHKSENLEETLNLLHDDGYTTYATANEDGAIDLPEVEYAKKSAIIIGSEGHGMQENIKNASKVKVRIPIDDTVAHLNAACSSSIFLYTLSQA